MANSKNVALKKSRTLSDLACGVRTWSVCLLPLLDMKELLIMKKIVQRKLLCWIQSQISVFMSKNKSYKVVSVFIMQYGLSVISCGLLDMDVGMLSKLSL